MLRYVEFDFTKCIKNILSLTVSILLLEKLLYGELESGYARIVFKDKSIKELTDNLLFLDIYKSTLKRLCLNLLLTALYKASTKHSINSHTWITQSHKALCCFKKI
jgi:hypothetical protein